MTATRRQVLLRLSTVLGVVLAVAGGAFVAGRIADGWSESKDVIAEAEWGWLVMAFVLASVGMASVGFVWRRVIAALGGRATRREIFVWYQIGQLGKYVPGGLWPMVGRSEMATRGGVRRSIAYNSVALSMGSTYLCATLVCAALLPAVIVTSDSSGTSLWLFALVPVGLAALHPAVLRRVFALAERALGKGEPQQVPPWRTSVTLVLRHTLSWLCIGLSTWFVAYTFDPEAPLLRIVFAGVLSWVTGFLVIFVPGGLGVREAAFVAAAGSALSPETAATVAVVSRLVFMSADALGAAAAAPLARRLPVPPG
ncbi:MAG: lysylphosphatidylglycerol synthase transmembrane domain-containing protein [Acidimicrobiales bacterium]